jgi:catechol 2,3-dioxygenase-like lactoylglutathione lyase family enzyme
MGIASVTIGVSDVDRAERFYSAFTALMGPCQICRFTKGYRLLPAGQTIELQHQGQKENGIRGIAFWIDDLDVMEKYLDARKVDHKTLLPVDGDRYLTLEDPDGREIQLIEYGRSYSWLSIQEEVKKSKPDTLRLIHAGFVVKDRTAMDKFYKDLLGFHVYWHGGMRDDETNWVDMQVPDGTDWVEYMLAVPDNADQRLLGVMNHFALGVVNVKTAENELGKAGVKMTEDPKIGRDGKWQLNLYDPDLTRVELMEFTPSRKPCCSEYTGNHPGP